MLGQFFYHKCGVSHANCIVLVDLALAGHGSNFAVGKFTAHLLLSPLCTRCGCGGQARSQDFVKDWANLARAQSTPYQKPKTPQI